MSGGDAARRPVVAAGDCFGQECDGRTRPPALHREGRPWPPGQLQVTQLSALWSDDSSTRWATPLVPDLDTLSQRCAVRCCTPAYRTAWQEPHPRALPALCPVCPLASSSDRSASFL